MATIKEQRERLEALFATAPGITSILDRYKDDTEPIPTDQLPGVIVFRAGRAAHESPSSDDYFSTRLWLAWVVVQEIEDMNRESKRAADDTAEELLDPIIKYLQKHRQLQLDDVDLPGVEGITVRDDGVKEDQVSGKRYSVLPILIDVGNTTDTGSE